MAEFPLPMSEAFLGTFDNPALSQTYRKAVIRPAPSSFTIQIHPPTKQGANYHYGMRVIPLDAPSSPVQSSARSTRTTKSVKGKEYDIFRRWDDCLEFQRTLEVEYDLIAHRRRKGQPAFNHHAKRALYPHQRAASFDSLPLGPDPSSIASNVHEYIPKLSKKNNLFGRANQALVSQRGEEFKRMIEALICDPDAHSTIEELRTVPLVRDFFALWRRDKEAERRSSKTASTAFPVPPLFPSSTALDETSNNVIGTINEDSVSAPGGGDSVATGLPVPMVPNSAGANVPAPKSPGGLNPYLLDFVKPHSSAPSSAKKKPSRHSLAPATRSDQTRSGGSVGSGESDGPRRPNTGNRPHTSAGSGGEERSAANKLAPVSPNPFKQPIEYYLQPAGAPADPSARRGRTAYPPPPYQQPSGPIPSRPVRSNTLPLDSASSDYHDGPGNASYSSQHQPHLQSTGSREALVLRSVNNGLGNQELPIPRAGSMPPERQRRKPPSPISTPRIADSNGNQPLPVFMLPQHQHQQQQHPYPAQPYPYPAQGVQGQNQVPPGYLRNGQPGWGRRATLRDADGEESDGVATPASAPLLTSFPFGGPDSPMTPGLAGRGRPSVPNLGDHSSRPSGRRNLGSLAVLDPEMFRAQQGNSSREALSDRPATSSGELSSQPIPRARKTPPIHDNGNRSARFFAHDPQNGMVDVASGPPPVSPGGHGSGYDYSEPEGQRRGVVGRRPYGDGGHQMVARPESNVLDADMDQFRPGSSGAGLTKEGSSNSIQLANQYQHPNMAMKLSQPPPGKSMAGRPRPTIDPNSYGAPPYLDTSRALGSGHNPTLSVISGVSGVPSLTSQNATLSWSSQASPSSPTAANGIPQPRYRSRVSMNSIEARRLSLDSLMTMSEYELPYLSSVNPNNAGTKNLVGNPHRFSKQNKSVDALYAAANGKPRSSYSSQDTDSTGTGGLPDDGSGGSSANRVYPTKSPLIAAKSTPPPPRPPRSALRNSSQFSAGVINRLNESLAAASSSPNLNPSTEALPEMPNFAGSGASKHDSQDFIDHYFPSPQLRPQILDTVPPSLNAKTTAKKPRESNMSTVTNFAQYYQNTPEMYARELDSFVPSLPPTPYTTTFDLSATESSKASHRSAVSRNSSTSLPSGVALVKASYVGSETIVVFKVSRADTTLHDLRAKLIRKFKETDGRELQPFSLKYIVSHPQNDRSGNPTTGRQRTLSITSAFDSSLADLNTEEDWQNLLSSSTKIMIKIL